MTKELTIRSLVDAKPTQADYDEYVKIIADAAKEMFNKRLFHLYLAETPDKYNVIQIPLNENLVGTEKWNTLIEKKLVHQIDLEVANRKLSGTIEKTFPIGDDITVLTYETETSRKFNPETGKIDEKEVVNTLTGVGDPTEMADIKVNIVFVADESLEEFNEAAEEQEVAYH